MKTNDEKYNSIPFTAYFAERNGKEVIIDDVNRIVKIKDKDDNISGIVHYSININHTVDRNMLLDNTSQERDKVYYVYQDGTKGRDWLWHYGDLISLDKLL